MLEKIVNQKILVPKKIFGSKKVLGTKKNLGPINLLSKHFESQICWTQKNVWFKNNFGPQKTLKINLGFGKMFWSAKNFGSEKYFGSKERF